MKADLESVAVRCRPSWRLVDYLRNDSFGEQLEDAGNEKGGATGVCLWQGLRQDTPLDIGRMLAQEAPLGN